MNYWYWLKICSAATAVLLVTTFADAGVPIPLITAGNNHICIADGVRNNGVYCYGDADLVVVRDTPKDLRTVQSLTAGAWHTCAVFLPQGPGSNQIACWGDNRFGQSSVPKLAAGEIPLQVTAGPISTCALVASSTTRRIACWGYPGHRFLDVPAELTQPVSIASSGGHVCAVNNAAEHSKVYCWGDELNGSWPLTLVGIQLTDTPWCQKGDGDSVVCTPQRPFRPAISGSAQSQVAVNARMRDMSCKLGGPLGKDFSCKRDGDTSAGFKTTLQGDGYDLSVGIKLACALHTEGVSCLDFSTNQLLDLPIRGQYLRYSLTVREPSDISAILQILATYSYSFDAAFLSSWQSRLAGANDHQYKIALAALSGYLTNFPYQSVRAQRLEKFAASLQKVLTTEDLQGSSVTKDDHDLIIGLIAAGIHTAKPVLLRVADPNTGIVQAEEAGSLVAQLGQASAIGQVSPELKDRLVKFTNVLAVNSYVGERAPVLMWLIQRL